MTKDAELKLALEALEADELDMVDDGSGNMVFRKEQAITVINDALAQPEQEPVVFNTLASLKHKKTVGPIERAMLNITPSKAEQEPVAMRYDFDGYGYKYIDNGSGSDWKTRIKEAEPVYPTPPKRKPLTDEQIQFYADQEMDVYSFARAIEAAHGIKE